MSTFTFPDTENATTGLTLDDKLGCVAGGVLTVLGIGDVIQQATATSAGSSLVHLVDTAVGLTGIWDGTVEVFEMEQLNHRDNVAAHAMANIIDIFKNTTCQDFIMIMRQIIARPPCGTSPRPTLLIYSMYTTIARFLSHISQPVLTAYTENFQWSSIPNADSTVPRFHTQLPLDYGDMAVSTSKARRQCSGDCFDQNIGQDDICTYPARVPAGTPSTMYYGFDLYGTGSEVSEFEDDLGSTYDNQNSFVVAGVQISEDINNAQAWDTCVCEMTQNIWVATGSAQLSGDNTYNGFSPCWNPNCDNAAII